MSPNSLIQSVSRSLDIIECICRTPEGMGVTQLASELGLAKTTAHRILRALVERGYIYQDPASGVYGPGTKILELAGVLRGSMVPQYKIGPLVRDLERQTGEYAYFATVAPDRRSIVVCNEESSRQKDVLVGSSRGKSFPVHGDGARSAFVAQMSDYHREAVVRHVVAKLSSEEAGRFKESLKAPLQDYYVSQNTMGAGVTSVASVVKDHTGYAVGILGALAPTYRMADPESLARAVTEVAGRASLALGCADAADGAAAAGETI